MKQHTLGPWHVGMRPGPMIYGPNGEQIADMRRMCATLQRFTEWHAENFGDFSSELNAQLLCLANDADAAIAKAKGTK